MNAIVWTEALALQLPRMDQTHREFVELLHELGDAVDRKVADLDPLLLRMTEHTVAHFAQEERWMRDIGFAADNCHSMQHAQVLQVLAEVRDTLRDQGPNPKLVRVLAEELGNWFLAHARMMDAALVQLMLEAGYDPESGRFAQARPEQAPITGCGGASCS